jgi:dinuclear metal center YbgI/SA1388 family protein
VIEEARRTGANLILSHHPLVFRPLRSVSTGNEIGRCIRALAKNDITLFSAHTNLDFTRGGTSFALADKLGVSNVRFLSMAYQLRKKIVTFVPPSHIQAVVGAMAEAGAGIIGNYERCSFRTEGIGTFRGNASSHPAVGSPGRDENVREIRLEMVVSSWDVEKVIAALLRVHPYEEVAYDLYPLENTNDGYGMGAIGTLPRPMTAKAFLAIIKRRLATRALRATGSLNATIRRVALCGGSGAELIDEAIRQDADIFVTADVKYHAFHHAAGKILLVDAGHYETEYPVVGAMTRRLEQELDRRGEKIPLRAVAFSTNPIRYM